MANHITTKERAELLIRESLDESSNGVDGQLSLRGRIDQIFAESHVQIAQQRQQQEAQHLREKAEFDEQAIRFDDELASQEAQFQAELHAQRSAAAAKQAAFDDILARREKERLQTTRANNQQPVQMEGESRPPPSYSDGTTDGAPHSRDLPQSTFSYHPSWEEVGDKGSRLLQVATKKQLKTESNFGKNFGHGFGSSFGQSS